MRKSAGKIFATGFLKSLLFLMLVTIIIVASYKLVMYFYDVEDSNVIEAIPPVKKQALITEARIDDVSKHLIYCVDEESGDITKLILEIFNCENVMLYYITIPIKTQLTLSDSLHRELVLIKPSIPSFLKLSAITGYLPKENVYEYGVLMIEELLDIQISYFTVVPQSIYNTVFDTEIIKRKANNLQNSENIFPREVFSDSFLEHLHTISTETELRNYIEELYDEITSNLSFEDKLNYMESYLNTPGKNIVFEVIAGADSNSAYTINELEAAKQLKDYLGE
ncbi:MAG: hypothetical protein GX129_05750 [Clostridiales bacterium]|nr:hypothetical protein [Clostridiales bacterium]